MDLHTPGLTVGELAARTGVGVSALRAWERRYGFPVPRRLASGHRRYSDKDAEAILDLLRDRQAGATMQAAVRRAAARTSEARSSIYAAVRDSVSGVGATALSTSAMLAVSRAIEDESVARGTAPILVGAFQQDRFWRRSHARWRDLAATAHAAVAMAAGGAPSRDGPLWKVALPAGSPLVREWAVVCDSPTFSACLVGIERPRRSGARDQRTFEAIWTVEPFAVREATRVAVAAAAKSEPGLHEPIEPRLREPAVASYDTIRAATALTNRIVAELDRISTMTPPSHRARVRTTAR